MSQITQFSTAGSAVLDVIYEVTTIDATPTTIFGVTIGEDSAINLVAHIVAAKDDYTASIGGSIGAIARRETAMATMLGASAPSVIEDSTTGNPTFTAALNGNDLEILVTGEAVTTYNWKARISYDIQNT